MTPVPVPISQIKPGFRELTYAPSMQASVVTLNAALSWKIVNSLNSKKEFATIRNFQKDNHGHLAILIAQRFERQDDHIFHFRDYRHALLTI